MKSRHQYNKPNQRPRFLQGAIILFAVLIVVRLGDLQILNYKFYAALASGQQSIFRKLFPLRGSIFTREGTGELYPLATNQEMSLIYAVPMEIDNPVQTAEKLAVVLGTDEEELFNKLNKKNDPYEPLKHKLSDAQAEEIKALKLKGIYFGPETFRFYPEKNIGGHILGFIGFKGDSKVGMYGLEGYFEDDLVGQPGYLRTERDAFGSVIAIGERSITPARDGDDLVLTIDRVLQYKTCTELQSAVKQYEADKGTIIIMEPDTGRILSLCNEPDYEPAEYASVEDISIFNNPAIFDQYEPGSVFKPITMAAALDSGKVAPTTVYTDEGCLKFDKYRICNSDFKNYGRQNMVGVLEKSINTGAIFAARAAGKDVFKDYVQAFGFGALTGIELDTENAGNISSLDKKGDIYMATASFGQGITVTPLQLVAAYAAIANGGKLVKPYIVEEILRKNAGTRPCLDQTCIGQVLPEKTVTTPKIIRQVISPRAATLLSGMLVSVIENGHAKRAGVPGYYLAGKTGTAEVPEAGGGYGDKTIHTFVGFGPVDEPKFVMLVKLDNPKNVRFADSSTAPVFSKLAKFLLEYYEIPPERGL
ncbi:MAG: penicillin-binding protein 2 [Candidatus Doudnabacteria bacterium]|nr:penicillin-binding protein 2 [Candidatus Doudnabacteria bacterium]